MSDVDNGKAPKGWTDREVLVYLVTAMEASKIDIDYSKVPCPPGRNANGCAQKMRKLKTQLKGDIAALKAGVPFDGAAAAAATTPKKTATPRKRKVKGGGEVEVEGSPTKKGRGRPRKEKVGVVEKGIDMEKETEGEEGVEVEVRDEMEGEEEI